MPVYLLAEPDALAFVLLLFFLGAAVAVALYYGKKRDRERSQANQTEETIHSNELIFTWPYLIKKELFAALVTLLILSWWAILLEVPLGSKANPEVTPALTKAPWFFVGIQEMLQYFDPWLAGVVLPLILFLGLCALPYLDVNPEGNGTYSLKARPLMLWVVGALLLLWLLPLGVGLLFRGDNWTFQPIWHQAVPSEALPRPLYSLAERLHLSPAVGQWFGAALCLGPLLCLFFVWPMVRHHSWVSRLGFAKFSFAGFLFLSTLGVVIKIMLHLVFDIRYLWVTPWFRI